MQRPTPPLLLAFVLSGCVSGATGTAASTSTGGTTGATNTTNNSTSPTTSLEPSTGTSPDSTSASTNTGTAFILDEPDILPPECDFWIEDCPEGQKCMPVSLDGDSAFERLMCVPIAPNPDQLGDPCKSLGNGVDGLDTCDFHMMCWNFDPITDTGTCSGICTGSEVDPGCADPNASCVIAGGGILALCIPDCDPLAQDCPFADLCIPHFFSDGHFFCILDASGDEGQVFDPCEAVNACDPGLLCVPPENAAECDPMVSGCCLPLCDLTQPNTCPGQGQQCLPWFPDAAPKFVNVGMCALPMP